MSKRKSQKKSIAYNYMTVYDSLQLEAVEGYLTKSITFFERKVRRWYSKTFSTPLHETYNLPWNDILLNYYESTLEKSDYNQVYESMLDMIPEFAKEREKWDEEFAKQLELEQARAIEKKAKKDPKFKDKVEKVTKTEKKDSSLSEVEEQIQRSVDRIKNVSDRIRKDDVKKESLNKDSKSDEDRATPTPASMNLQFDDEEFDPEN